MKSPTERNIEARTGSFTGYLRSSLAAAVIAFVIYLAVYALTTGGLDLVTGFIIAGITFVITFAISALIGAVTRRRR